MNSSLRPITILHIFGRMRRGGAEMRTLEVMRHLDRNKYRFWFCCLSGRPGELDEEIRQLGGEVFYCSIYEGFPGPLLQLLRSAEVDAVHSHVHFFSGYILRLAAKAKIPVRIAHFRNTNDGSPLSLRKRAQNLLMRFWIGRHATHILAVCTGAMEMSWGERWRNDPRCKVIYNGFDLATFAGAPEPEAVRQEFGFPPDSKLCIHVGRLTEAKNHRRLLAIFHLMVQHDPTVRLLLVGRGMREIERDLRRDIDQRGLGNKVYMTGERTDVPSLLQAANLMIFPSKWEGLPGAVIEACAAGVPVLASSLPGTEEIARHFPGSLHLLPLTRSDREWCERAISLLESADTRLDTSRLEPFQQGAFSMERCLADLETVWSSHGKTCARAN